MAIILVLATFPTRPHTNSLSSVLVDMEIFFFLVRVGGDFNRIRAREDMRNKGTDSAF